MLSLSTRRARALDAVARLFGEITSHLRQALKRPGDPLADYDASASGQGCAFELRLMAPP